MNPFPQHLFWLSGAASLGLLLVLHVQLNREASRTHTPVPAPPSVRPESFQAEPSPAFPDSAWEKFAPSQASGGLARRFRLAGTLFGEGSDVADIPLAVIDDRVEVRQHLVRQGEELLEGIRLVDVKPGSILLEGPEGQAELFLERADARKGGFGSGSSNADLAENRFGGQEVFPGRWSFSRDKLLDYYTELRAEPERLVAIFDSMEPLWKDGDPETHIIEGYQLNVQGEGAFFEAMGMKQGDIVRAVNSIKMSNRRRAERCIAAFVQGEESTFVFDIERNGTPEQQVYVFE